MQRIRVKWNDFKEDDILVNGITFEQTGIVVDHPDFSKEYLNRQFVKSVRVYKEQTDIPVWVPTALPTSYYLLIVVGNLLVLKYIVQCVMEIIHED